MDKVIVITTTNLPLIYGDAQRKTVVQDATPHLRCPAISLP